MQIILEGCDGTGKSTLAKKLAEKYNLSNIHLTRYDPTTYFFYSTIFKKTNVVFDRSYISEYIYPKLRNQTSMIQYHDIVRLFKRDEPIVIILTGDLNLLASRLKDRGEEDSYIIEKLSQIIEKYNYISSTFDIYTIDVSTLSMEQVLDRAIQYIEERRK